MPRPAVQPTRDHVLKKEQSQIVRQLEARCLSPLVNHASSDSTTVMKDRKKASQNKASASFWAKQEEIYKDDWIKAEKEALKIGILFAFIIFEVRQMEANLSSCEAQLDWCNCFPNFDVWNTLIARTCVRLNRCTLPNHCFLKWLSNDSSELRLHNGFNLKSVS